MIYVIIALCLLVIIGLCLLVIIQHVKILECRREIERLSLMINRQQEERLRFWKDQRFSVGGRSNDGTLPSEMKRLWPKEDQGADA